MPEKLLIAEAFKRGLFPGSRPIRNDSYLVEAENVRIGKNGLEKPPIITNPANDEVLGDQFINNYDFSSGSTYWSVGANWSITGGVATHTPGSAQDLKQLSTSQAIAIYSGSWYVVEVDVATATAGSFNISIGDFTSADISTAGKHSYTLYTGRTTVYEGVDLAIKPTSDFSGSLNYISVKRLARGSFSYWPFPQLALNGYGGKVLLYSGNVYEDLGSGYSKLAFYDADTGSATSLSTAVGDSWHWAPINKGFVAVNSDNALFYAFKGWEEGHGLQLDILDDSSNWTLGGSTTIVDGVMKVSGSGTSTYTNVPSKYNLIISASNLSGSVTVNGSPVTEGFTTLKTQSGNIEVATTSGSAYISGITILPTTTTSTCYARTDGLYTSVCEFQGRILMAYKAGTLPYFGSVSGPGIAWTSVGADDLLLLAGSAAYDPSDLDEDFHDYRGGIGYIDFPTNTTILALIPSRGGVLVYTTSGVWIMEPVVEPVPTFGLRYVHGLVPLTRATVAGSLDRHVILDTKYRLWTIDASLRVELLGYDYHLNGPYGQPTLKDKTVVVSYDSLHDDFYISGVTSSGLAVWLSYLLSPYGLSRVEWPVCSLIPHEGGSPSGVYFLTSEDTTSTDYRARAVTTVFDMGSRSIKTIDDLQFAMTVDNADFDAEVHYNSKFDARSDFPAFTGPTAGYVTLSVNYNGYAVSHVSGAEFKVVMSAKDFNNWSSLEYVKIGWHKSGKKSLKYFVY